MLKKHNYMIKYYVRGDFIVNKEYIYLSSEELVVTDEQGHAKKRVVESENMHDLLLLENNLEQVNNLINKIEETNKSEIKLNPKEKFVFYTIPFGFTGILCAIVFGASVISNNPWLTTEYISMFGSAILVSGGVDVFFALGEKRLKKVRLGREAQLSKAYEIKESIEKELSEIKEKKETLTKSKKDKTIYEQNDLIVLEASTPARDEIIKQLNDSYVEGYNQSKPKRLVLTKTSKK